MGPFTSTLDYLQCQTVLDAGLGLINWLLGNILLHEFVIGEIDYDYGVRALIIEHEIHIQCCEKVFFVSSVFLSLSY